MRGDCVHFLGSNSVSFIVTSLLSGVNSFLLEQNPIFGRAMLILEANSIKKKSQKMSLCKNGGKQGKCIDI